jgi:hypothetical protein
MNHRKKYLTITDVHKVIFNPTAGLVAFGVSGRLRLQNFYTLGT